MSRSARARSSAPRLPAAAVRMDTSPAVNCSVWPPRPARSPAAARYPAAQRNASRQSATVTPGRRVPVSSCSAAAHSSSSSSVSPPTAWQWPRRWYKSPPSWALNRQDLAGILIEFCKARDAGNGCPLQLPINEFVVLHQHIAAADHLQSVVLVQADEFPGGTALVRRSVAPKGVVRVPVPWKLRPVRGFWSSSSFSSFSIVSPPTSMVFMV